MKSKTVRKSSLEKLKQDLIKGLISKKIAVIVFVLFFICGIFIVKDYGAGADDNYERVTSLVNYVHVWGPLMRASEHESVRVIAENTPELATYEDRYYGVALQSITVLAEHLFGFRLGTRYFFLIRHIFVFFNYFLAGIFFYLILRLRFGESVFPLLGVLVFILSPRFFAEAFYNIKDNLFFSWMVISGCFVLRWLEDRRARFYILAAAALAVAINTRILGLSLLLLACAFAAIIAIRQRMGFLRVLGRPLALFGLTLAFWILITPFLWLNPINNMVATFDFFLNVVEWDGVHLYLGEMISRHVPWHYLPVWMGITIPIPYIALFVVGAASTAVNAIGWIKRRAARPNELDRQHLYDLFMAALFFCTLFGFIILRISMYNGWRHAYGIYFPFIYIAVYGLSTAINYLTKKHVALRRIGLCAVTATFAYLLGWICVNHPYQYAYFNVIGRQVAERNFELDCWEVSHTDLVRFALAYDDRPRITISGLEKHAFMLTEEERTRAILNIYIETDYYLQNTSIPYAERTPPEGFEELKSIKVDGMIISALYKRIGQ